MGYHPAHGSLDAQGMVHPKDERTLLRVSQPSLFCDSDLLSHHMFGLYCRV